MSDIAIVWLAFAQTQPEAAPPPAAQAPRVPGSVGTSSQPGSPTGPGNGAGGGGGGGGGPPPGFNMIWIILAFVIAMVIMTSMTGRREKRRRETLMSSLKKGDQVQTLGGIIGTIVEIHDNDVILRVDEVSNTRIRFARSAVQGVLRESKSSGSGGGGTEVEPKLKSQTASV